MPEEDTKKGGVGFIEKTQCILPADQQIDRRKHRDYSEGIRHEEPSPVFMVATQAKISNKRRSPTRGVEELV